MDYTHKMITCPYCGNERPLGKDCTCAEAVAESERIEREYKEEKEKEKQKTIENRLARAGVPSHFWSASHEEAKELSNLMMSGTSIYIFGESMVGKTYLGYAVLREIASETYKPIKLIDASRFFDDAFNFQTKTETFNTYGKANFLMLDGLGTGEANRFTIPNLRQLVDMRYNANKPTLYTSIYGFDELFNKLGRHEEDEQAVYALKARMKENCKGRRISKRSRNA